MIRYFDRYIFKEIIPPFFIGLLVYSFVLLMNQIFLLSELLIARGVSFSAGFKILVYLVPSILAFSIPMSVLVGILAGFSRLSSDSEVVAFMTLGIGTVRFLKPVFSFALLGWLFTSFLTLYLAPRANYLWVQTLTNSVLAKVQFRINPREFYESIPNTVLFIQEITPDHGWKNVFVHISPSPQEKKVILARSGRLNSYPEVKRATLELYDGSVHSFSLKDPASHSLTFFDRILEEINVESFFATFSNEKRVREKDIGELVRSIENIRRSLEGPAGERKPAKGDALERGTTGRVEADAVVTRKTRELRSQWVEVHKKFALPFVCLIFVLIGIPLGVSTQKGGRTGGFTISLAVILVYYILITGGEKMAMDGKLSPFLGMWGPNFLFLLAGLWLFRRSALELPLLSFIFRLGRRKPEPGKRVPLTTERKRGLGRLRFSLRFPNILDRYVIRKYAALFFLIFLALVSISVIVTFFERIDNIYEHNKPPALLLIFILYKTPEFIHFALPVAALTTTLLALGLMTKANEITAAKACGISLYRIIASLIFPVLVVCLASFSLQERLLPYANKKAEETWNRINDVPARSYEFLDRRWVLGRDKSRIYHYGYFDPIAGVFGQPTVFDVDTSAWELRRIVRAEKGYLVGTSLFLRDAWARSFGDGVESRFEKAKEIGLPVAEEASYFLKEWKEISVMNYSELKRYAAEVEEMGFDTTRYKVDLASKTSFPLVSLVMTLLGIPFAFSMGKRGALVGVGLSIVIAMLYWGTLGVVKSLGYVGILSPFLSAWGSNLIFGGLGLILLFRLRT